MRIDSFLVAWLRRNSAAVLAVASWFLLPAVDLPATTLIFTLPVEEHVGPSDESLYEACDRASATSRIRGAAAAAEQATRLSSRKITLRRDDRSLTAVAGVNEYYAVTPDLPPALPVLELEQLATATVDPLDALFADDFQAPLPPPVDRGQRQQALLPPAPPAVDRREFVLAETPSSDSYVCGTAKNGGYDAYINAYDGKAQWYDDFHRGPLELDTVSDETCEICVDPAIAQLLHDDCITAWESVAAAPDGAVWERSVKAAPSEAEVTGESYSDWIGDDYDPYVNGQLDAADLEIEKRTAEDAPTAASRDQSRLDFGDLIDRFAQQAPIESAQEKVLQENADYFAQYGRLGYGDYEHADADALRLAENEADCLYDCFPLNSTAGDDVVTPAVRQTLDRLRDGWRLAVAESWHWLAGIEFAGDQLDQLGYFGQVANARPAADPRAEYVTRQEEPSPVASADYLALALPPTAAKLPRLDNPPTVGLVDRALGYAERTAARWSQRFVSATESFQATIERLSARGDRQHRAAQRPLPRLDGLQEF